MHYICTTIVAIASFCITGSSLGDHLLLRRAQLNGYTVAIDGDTCVIGTHGTNSYTGSAYLYTLGASGLWNQVAELSGEANYDSFGYRVAIDGNTCVIGAYGTNSFAGSAYFYTSDASGTWNQVAALSGEESSGGFGYSVAIDGNTCVIGADGTNSYAGSAYVYSLDASGIWNQVAELSGEESWDQFGTSVAIDGDTCVIGAPGTNDTGSAYVYTSDASGTWNQVDELSGEAIHGHFGSSVAIDGNTCVIGAYGTNDTGSAYFYTSDASGTWNQVAALSGEESNGGFGYSVAIDGHACVIGAPGTNSHTGSAYVYTSDASGTWNQVLAISGEANYDSFGYQSRHRRCRLRDRSTWNQLSYWQRLRLLQHRQCRTYWRLLREFRLCCHYG